VISEVVREAKKKSWAVDLVVHVGIIGLTLSPRRHVVPAYADGLTYADGCHRPSVPYVDGLVGPTAMMLLKYWAHF
jgi:hypothetical protein